MYLIICVSHLPVHPLPKIVPCIRDPCTVLFSHPTLMLLEHRKVAVSPRNLEKHEFHYEKQHRKCTSM